MSSWDVEMYSQAAQLYADIEKIIASGKGSEKCERGIVEAYTKLTGENQYRGLGASTPTFQELLIKVGQVKAARATRLTFWERLKT